MADSSRHVPDGYPTRLGFLASGPGTEYIMVMCWSVCEGGLGDRPDEASSKPRIAEYRVRVPWPAGMICKPQIQRQPVSPGAEGVTLAGTHACMAWWCGARTRIEWGEFLRHTCTPNRTRSCRGGNCTAAKYYDGEQPARMANERKQDTRLLAGSADS